MNVSKKAALALALGTAMLVTPAAVASGSWLAQVVQTPEGGHRMGNPDAKVKLIEFVSYTCPHCAHFHSQSKGPLQLAYVMPGKVSVEVRSVIRNPVDLAATLLAECGPESKFAANSAAFFDSQATWLKKAASATEATQVRWRSGTVAQRMRAIASDLGFYDIMEKRGYDRVAADRCLSNEAEARRIGEQAEKGEAQYGVESTPSFVIDGNLLLGTHTWDTLQPQIAARL